VIALDKTGAVGLVFAKPSIQVLGLAKRGQVVVGLDKTRVVGIGLAKTGAGRGRTRAVGLVFAKPASSVQFVENGAGGSRLCESNGCGARFSKNAGRLCDNEGGGGPWQNREPRYSVWQKRERVVREHSISGVVGSSAVVWLEKAERA